MLSVPSLVKKHHKVVPTRESALIGLKDIVNILETTYKVYYELLYISDQQDSVPNVPANSTYSMKVMMEAASRHVQTRDD